MGDPGSRYVDKIQTFSLARYRGQGSFIFMFIFKYNIFQLCNLLHMNHEGKRQDAPGLGLHLANPYLTLTNI